MLTNLAHRVMELPPLANVAIALAIGWYLKHRFYGRPNIPPLPVYPLPVLGHLPMMGINPLKKLHEWRQSKGDIFSIYMGQTLAVVISDFNIMKEALVKKADVFSDRAVSFAGQNLENGHLGIIESSGSNWKEQRTVSLSILKRFGMGKNFLADKISEEVEAYTAALAQFKGQPMDMREMTDASVSNIICAILVGNRFDFDDPYFAGLLSLLNQQVLLMGDTALLTCFPWLKHIPGDVFNARKVLDNSNAILDQFSEKFIKENKDLREEDKTDNYINAYQEEMMKRQKSGEPTTLSDENLLFVIGNLFIAGTVPVSATLMWAILFAIRNPETQEKVYQEILEVIGTERPPTLQDRPKMKYTYAYILETIRLGCISPLGLPHMCTQTSELAGYTIPKGTSVMFNAEEMFKDPQLWEEPLVFKPERFLDKENNIEIPETFAPFGIGRRLCLGESLAKMELFLFVTGIFQRFHIKPEHPEELPSQESVFGLTCVPKAFKPRLDERST